MIEQRHIQTEEPGSGDDGKGMGKGWERDGKGMGKGWDDGMGKGWEREE